MYVQPPLMQEQVKLKCSRLSNLNLKMQMSGIAALNNNGKQGTVLFLIALIVA